MSVFLTATDTGAGKTFVAALLLRHLRATGQDAVGFKPICCGSREDAEILLAASGGEAAGVTLNDVNPVWLRTPAAPYTASMIEGRLIDLELVREKFAALRARHETVLVEGVGGWLAPIAQGYAVADLAGDFKLPVVVVVRNRLGALNHAALTVRHITQLSGLVCAGLIFNEVPARPSAPHPSENAGSDNAPEESIARATNRAICEEMLGLPILGEVEAGQQTWPEGGLLPVFGM